MKDLFCWFGRALECPSKVGHDGSFTFPTQCLSDGAKPGGDLLRGMIPFWLFEEIGVLPRPQVEVANCDLLPGWVDQHPYFSLLVGFKPSSNGGLLGCGCPKFEVFGSPFCGQALAGLVAPLVLQPFVRPGLPDRGAGFGTGYDLAAWRAGEKLMTHGTDPPALPSVQRCAVRAELRRWGAVQCDWETLPATRTAGITLSSEATAGFYSPISQLRPGDEFDPAAIATAKPNNAIAVLVPLLLRLYRHQTT